MKTYRLYVLGSLVLSTVNYNLAATAYRLYAATNPSGTVYLHY